MEFTYKPVKQTNKLLQFRVIGKKGHQEDILKVKSEKIKKGKEWKERNGGRGIFQAKTDRETQLGKTYIANAIKLYWIFFILFI